MAVVTTKKFQFRVDGVVRIFRPGTPLTNEGVAKWAMQSGYAEDRKEGAPPRTQRKPKPKGAPESADADQESDDDLDPPGGAEGDEGAKGAKGAPENADAAQVPEAKQPKRKID